MVIKCRGKNHVSKFEIQIDMKKTLESEKMNRDLKFEWTGKKFESKKQKKTIQDYRERWPVVLSVCGFIAMETRLKLDSN